MHILPENAFPPFSVTSMSHTLSKISNGKGRYNAGGRDSKNDTSDISNSRLGGVFRTTVTGMSTVATGRIANRGRTANGGRIANDGKSQVTPRCI